MKELWRTHWIAWLIALVLLVGITAVVNLWQDVGRPFGGFVVGRSVAGNYWDVATTTPPWWPGLVKTGLLPRDKLLRLDNRPYDENQWQVYAAAYQRGDRLISLESLRDGVKTVREIHVVPFTITNFLDIKIPDLINGLCFWLLAIVVYSANPTDPVNRVFTVACCLFAWHRWSLDASLFLDSDPLTNFLDLSNAIVAPIAASMIIHFLLVFPRRSSRYTKAIYPLYGLATMMAAAFCISRFLWWWGGWTELVAALDRTGYQGSLLVLAVSSVGVIGRFTWLLFHNQSPPRLRRQSLVILAGFCFSLPFIGVTILEGFIDKVYYFWQGLNIRYLLLAVPLSFAYVILRYRAFQGSNPYFVGVLVYAVSALLSSIGDGIVRWSYPHSANLYILPPFIPIFAITLTTGLFWSTQSSWRGLFGRLLHWEARSYSAVRRFGYKVVDQMNTKEIPNLITASLVSELELEQAALWLQQEDQHRLRLVGLANHPDESLPESLPIPPGDLHEFHRPLRLGIAHKPIPPWIKALQNIPAIEVVAPMRIGDRAIGLLGLGRRWDEEIFDERDLEIIELIAQQAAFIVLTTLQLEELRQVPRQVAEAQERERYKIAQELHDTIQQFLGRLPFYLEVSRSEIQTDPEETDLILQRCITDVENAAHTVRQIRNNLTPGQLEKGIVQPLRDMVARFKMRTGLEIYLDAVPEIDLYLSLQARHALYRVIQQALDNVVTHAEANKVEIRLTRSDGGLGFVVKDDGRGSSESERAEARAQGSFGLQSMEARLNTLGGEFQLGSSPGRGTQVIGWLPANS
ncbi:MAG: ATP-binding protein [Chloroflexi bacterium]|nr:ATP-binding protein [Chloroflexota bacterium]MCI0649971.1 ATP-binding protein [Chloroflexota bacterium]MCI0725768.1 ATP-binding protein [Chloroflexota bacterium]